MPAAFLNRIIHTFSQHGRIFCKYTQSTNGYKDNVMQIKTLMEKTYELTIIMTTRGGTIYTERKKRVLFVLKDQERVSAL